MTKGIDWGSIFDRVSPAWKILCETQELSLGEETIGRPLEHETVVFSSELSWWEISCPIGEAVFVEPIGWRFLRSCFQRCTFRLNSILNPEYS